jgi:hypothetical protein
MWPFITQAQYNTLHANQLIIIRQGKKIMSDIDDLNNAVASLTTSVGTLATAVANSDKATQAAVQAILAGLASGNNEAVHTAALAIADASTKMAADATDIQQHADALTAALNPPAPTPTPAPPATP